MTHQSFDIIIMVFIICNTVILGLKWYNLPTNVSTISAALNYLFTIIFTLESILKILAYGKNYFRDNWNMFDFVVVVGTYAGILLGRFTSIDVGAQTSVIRAFRIMRIFRLVKKAKRLRVIFTTFVVTIPALTNVGILLMLLLFLYSILGSFLFAFILATGGGINEQANF